MSIPEAPVITDCSCVLYGATAAESHSYPQW
jgi:hypothetical protein